MALQRADAFFAADADDDEQVEVPGGIPRHGRTGAPKIRRVDDPTKFAFYHRASGFGKPLEDQYLINRRNLRLAVYELARRDDLQMEAQAVAGLEEKADRRELERIADAAISGAGGMRAATKGTALHKLRERRDAGEDLAFVGPKTRAALDVWSAMASRFTAHGSEQFVVCDRWQAAGTYDALWSPRWPMEAPDGTVIEPGEALIVDLKSGSWGPTSWGPTYCVQLAVYAHGVPYVHVEGEDGRQAWPWSIGGEPPRRDWALIPHVPLENPEDAGLVWVDLRRGERLAELAHQIREARKLDGLFLPAELPVEPVEPPLTDVVLEAIGGARSNSELTALWDRFSDVWADGHTAAVHARLAELSSATTEVRTS